MFSKEKKMKICRETKSNIMFYKQISCKTNLITNYIPLRAQVLPGPRDHVIDYKPLVKSGKCETWGLREWGRREDPLPSSTCAIGSYNN